MRGQAHTLEAVVAGLVLVTSLVFALQVTAVTPLTASTSSQHIENQLGASSDDVLEIAAEEGELKRAVLYWDESAGQFHNSDPRQYYISDDEVTDFTFGDMLVEEYSGRGIAFNLYVNYQVEDGSTRRERMVYRGEPSDNAVTVSRWVSIYESDVLYDASEQPTGVTVASSTSFYAPNVGADELYNLIEVEVVVWRM